MSLVCPAKTLDPALPHYGRDRQRLDLSNIPAFLPAHRSADQRSDEWISSLSIVSGPFFEKVVTQKAGSAITVYKVGGFLLANALTHGEPNTCVNVGAQRPMASSGCRRVRKAIQLWQ
jgi:hypothetical protein